MLSLEKLKATIEQDPESFPEVMTLDDVACYLQVEKTEVLHLVQRGLIPVSYIAGRSRISREALRQFHIQQYMSQYRREVVFVIHAISPENPFLSLNTREWLDTEEEEENQLRGQIRSSKNNQDPGITHYFVDLDAPVSIEVIKDYCQKGTELIVAFSADTPAEDVEAIGNVSVPVSFIHKKHQTGRSSYSRPELHEALVDIAQREAICTLLH